MTFEQLIELYALHLQGLRKTPSTLRNTVSATREFARHCQANGAAQPDRVESRHYTSWLAAMKGRHLAATTIYMRQRLIRTWFAWASLREHLLMDPLKTFGLLRHPKILGRGAPSEEQVRTMLQAPACDNFVGQRDHALMEFLYGTGLRLAECAAVRVEDLELQTGSVRVLHAKGGKQRQVPLGPNLQATLAHYLQTVRPGLKPRDESLWLTVHGRPLRGHNIATLVRKYRQACQIKQFSAHSFRHAYATHMLRRGAGLVALQRLMGHSTMQMTSRYTHLVPTDLQQELLRTHPRGKRKERRRRGATAARTKTR